MRILMFFLTVILGALGAAGILRFLELALFDRENPAQMATGLLMALVLSALAIKSLQKLRSLAPQLETPMPTGGLSDPPGGSAPSPATPERDASGPVGLRGWLVLVALGLIVTPVRLGAFVATTFPPILQDGTWELLTTPGSDAYHPLWAPMLVFEFAANTAFIAAALVLLVLFFKRSRRFPVLFIAFLAVSLVFVVGDTWISSYMFPDAPVLDPETIGEVGRAVLASLVWIPYMCVSKRVRNTFVE